MKTPKTLYLILAFAAHTALAQTAPPTFTDYPAPPEHLQTTHKALIRTPQSRRYATMLREAVTHPPDFAGHYILATVGCGASCVLAAAIDAKDGTVVWLPFTVCCWPLDITEPLEYKRNSRLLIVHGQRNEKGSNGSHVYALDPGKHRFVTLNKSPGH